MSLFRSHGILQLTRRSFSSSNTTAAIATKTADATTHQQQPQFHTDHGHPIIHFVFGANTDVGKTVLTAALIRAASAGRTHTSFTATAPTSRTTTHYIKPLQCGGSDESFVRKHAPNHLSSATTLFDWDTPSSPHFAARFENKPVSDEQVLEALSGRLRELGALSDPPATLSKDITETVSRDGRIVGRRSIWVETAGGVMSPSSSSPENRTPYHAKNDASNGWGWLPQADLYRAFCDRSSVILIGDGRLGGISSTLTALEALLHRKYTVGGILMIRGEDANGGVNEDDASYDSNLEALREYVGSLPSRGNGSPSYSTSTSLFANPEKSIISLPTLPPEPEPLNEWFASSEVQDSMVSFVHDHLFHSYGVDRS